MLRMSLQCFIVVFAFANLLVQGLVNEADAGQSKKPQTVEIVSNKSLPLEAKPNATTSKSGTNVTGIAENDKVPIKQNITVQSTKPIDTNKTELRPEPNVTSLVEHLDKPEQNKIEASTEKAEEKPSNPTNNTATVSTIKSENNNEASSVTSSEETPPTVSTIESTISSVTSASITTDSTSVPTTTSTVLANSTNSTNSTQTAISEASQTMKAKQPTEVPVHSAIVNDKPEEGMSSGIIALVMAIAFAIVVIIVYFGLLLWRRYLEYRYGNRELLVNDLEFDTNDLRHFEL